MDQCISPATEAEQPAVSALLCSVYGVPPDWPPLRADVLRWKYFAPGPEWLGARSFVVRGKGQIVAHVGLCPITLWVEGREVTSLTGMDWVASPSARGAGLLLLEHLTTLADTWLGVGGSEQARAIVRRRFPLYGYRLLFARVVRPWRQFLHYPSRDWKTPLRLARNVLWNAGVRRRLPPGWSAQPVEEFTEACGVCWQPTPHPYRTPCKRTPGLLNFMLRCPAAPVSGYLLHKHGQVRGCFLLARAGPQVRIVHLELRSGDQADWTAAYRVAAGVAASDPRAHELVAATTAPLAQAALRANGFRLCAREPIMLHDPKKYLTGQPLADLTLLDGDAGYLYNPAAPYCT